MSNRADRTSCKFDIQHQKIKNKEAVNAVKLTEKRIADSAKRLWGKFIHNSLINSEKKLLLFDTQIIIVIMFNKQLPSFSVPFTPVLSFVYHLSSTTSASSFILPFKISLISTFNWSLCLLWNAVNYCLYVSVKKQDFSADQIKDVWHISNESQLQLYAQ